MRKKARFEAAIKKLVVPTLRELRFTGSHPTFRRDDGRVAAVVNFQGSSGGDGCYLNLGVHHRALKERDTRWETLKEYECPFRARLLNAVGEDFFHYGESDAEAMLQVQGMAAMLKTEGKLWFDQLATEDALRKTVRSKAKSFVPYGPPASDDVFSKVAAKLGARSDVKKASTKKGVAKRPAPKKSSATKK